MDAEKQKVFNHNMKLFFDAIKADLDKPEDEVFNELVHPTWTVRDAKNANKAHMLFHRIIQRINGIEMAFVTRTQMRAVL